MRCRSSPFSALCGLVLAISSASTQAPDSTPRLPPPLDGVNRPMRDTLLEHFAGTWRVTRHLAGRTSVTGATVEWVLQHQFLRLQYQPDSGSPVKYEASVFIGYDNTSERYVAHWLDVFGGRWSETVGYGAPVRNGVRFVFQYPDGPFINTFTFDAVKREWHSALEQKNARGEWVSFGDEQFQRR